MIEPRVSDILNRERDRQDQAIELIASENFASTAVMDLCGSIFTCLLYKSPSQLDY